MLTSQAHTTTEFQIAINTRADRWVPACGGTETPFKTRTGRRLLYCYNAAKGRHAYVDLDADMALDNQEADAALGMV